MPTVEQLKVQVRAHNKKYCIRLSQKKAGLVNELAKVAAGAGAGVGPGIPMQNKKKEKTYTAHVGES